MQKLHDIKTTDYIDTGLIQLLERDITALTLMSGETIPEDAPENVFHNNLKDKKLYTNTDGWGKVIDYTSLYKTKGMLETNYQPLNHYLTEYSNVKVPEGAGVICYNVYRPISDYFRTKLLATTSNDSFTSLLGLGKIAFQNTLSAVYIKDYSVGKELLAKSIITEPPFMTGDIRMSYAQTSPNTNKWLKLAKGVTIGNTFSGANYTGVMFKELFRVLWANKNISMVNSQNASVARGTSYEVDWNKNNRIVLPDKPGYYDGIASGTTMFDSSKYDHPEKYTFTVTTPGYYEITLVSGGGGGFSFVRNYSKWWRGCAAGGSGAAFKAQMYFPTGSYDIGRYFYGGDGLGRWDTAWAQAKEGFTAYIGKATNASNVFNYIVKLTGGTGGSGCGRDQVYNVTGSYSSDSGNPQSLYTVGKGGTCSILNSSFVHKVIYQANGNPGTGYAYGIQWLGEIAGGASPASNIGLGSYGTGGSGKCPSQNSYVWNGNDGYAKLVYLGYLPPNDDNSNNKNNDAFFKDLQFYIKV